MDETEAITETLAGNRDAFCTLVRLHHRSLYYYVVGRIPNESEAEDVVQKAFVTAYTKLADYQAAQPFLPWLRGIALNHCRDLWKQHQRRSEMNDRLLDIRRAEMNLAALENTEEERVGDRVEALRSCMNGLSQFEQRAIHLRFVAGLSLEAIGNELNKNAEAARLFLFRIRRRLESCVKRGLAVQRGAR